MEGIVEGQLVLSPVAYFIAVCLDGHSDVIDIQHAFAQHANAVLASEDVLKVVEYLDEHGFLATPRFQAIHDEVLAAFRATDERAPYLAGNSYPNDPGELHTFLDDCLACAETDAGPAMAPVRCLIAPHIDFERGARVYGYAYKRLSTQPAPELALVFGVAHAGSSSPYMLTRKHFDTPLGVLANATDIVERLACGCTWDPYESELLHKTEHSIELQAVMLAHLFGPKLRIVPILCGAQDARPGAVAFLDRCRSIVQEDEGRVVVIAGADLAHIGIRFGDPFVIDDAIIERVRQRDEEDLAHVLALDADAFQQSVWRDGNARRVCGLGCIHAALNATGNAATHAEMLAYDYAHDAAGGIVSFAAIALT
ncbi:MAG: AmmeMemoRadiSam system protein B, partial [Candidatus Hydrogenedentes bacterium]|nr:AmmeMemoRadiSam system protein B [Candidatus Hydrogenedentota bacterium]